MAEISISIVGPEMAKETISLVSALLAELGDEDEDLGVIDVDVMAAAWLRHQDRHRVFLARNEDNELVGLATLATCFAIYAGGEYGIINEMYVKPAYRSESVGQKIIGAICDYGRDSGWQRIDVAAPESERWERTRKFYEREGFVFTGPKLKILL